MNETITGDMWIALIIVIATYTLIFRETIHRTNAAIIGAVLMVGAGMLFGFYTQEQAIEAIDGNTLLLLMGMMMLITLMKPTGGFEYMAIFIGKTAKGSPLRLLIYLSLTVSLISMILNNVTIVIIFAPLTVLMCRMLKLNPLPYLMSEAIMSNIGGIATLIGDPPNLMIGSQANIDFMTFLIHMGPITSVVWIISMLTLLFIFREYLGSSNQKDFDLNLDQTKAIKQPKRLKQILLILAIVVILFFVNHYLHLYPAYVALIGVGLALVLINPSPTELFGEVSWSVLIFFAGLFSIVGGLEASGLLSLIGMKLADIAKDPNSLLLTCLVLMWVSAALSAIIDNIPFTVTMIPIIQTFESQGVNITPLWWALVLGASLGGNGTHIGATANIICMSESEKFKDASARITPQIWLRKGLPVMIVSLTTSSIIFVVFFDFFL